MMKSILYKSMILGGVIALCVSCNKLDLGPIDYYGSESYWKTEAQVSGYVDGLHKHFRDQAWQHTIIFGEIRGGAFSEASTSGDGFTLSNQVLIQQNITRDAIGGPATFGNLFGRITNCNLLIARTTDAEYIADDKKNFYLAQAYGLRAYYYYDLYRIYGGVPIRTDVNVIDGELDPNKLYLERSTPEKVMDLIKSDITKSLELFGDNNKFQNYNQDNKVYWTKAASECLAADIYLWTAKVTTKWTLEDGTAANHVANPADINIAKAHLKDLEANYALDLEDDFAKIFDTKNKANKEIIFAVRYLLGEQTNNNNQFLYSVATGSTQASGLREDGTPWNDPLTVDRSQGFEYKKGTVDLFDEKDTRKDATFLISYKKDDQDNLTYRGSFVQKNIGHINNEGQRVFDGDYILYRLPWVYLSLAEVANYEGDNANVEKYINLVRERAYGEDWNVATYGYVAGDFVTNELAILNEKTKEFIQEGQRWWDIRRMTSTKGGDPLVFDLRAGIDRTEPILDKATEEHKLLWPVDQNLLNNDLKIKQTPGY